MSLFFIAPGWLLSGLHILHLISKKIQPSIMIHISLTYQTESLFSYPEKSGTESCKKMKQRCGSVIELWAERHCDLPGSQVLSAALACSLSSCEAQASYTPCLFWCCFCVVLLCSTSTYTTVYNTLWKLSFLARQRGVPTNEQVSRSQEPNATEEST